MRQFYNTHRKIFYSLFFLLCLGTGFAKGAAFTFTVAEPCVPNPACAANGTVFTEDPTSNAIGWSWDFGDGATSNLRNPLHPYAGVGQYEVTLTRTLPGGVLDTPEKQTITIGEIPPDFQNWKDEETICPGQSLTLDPYPNGAPSGATFLWAPNGETTQTIKVDKSKCYSVQVTLPNGCKREDLINVKVCMQPAGQEGAKWYFGNKAGLDFSSSPPAPLTDGKINAPEGTSSIASSQGQLLFYSDGISIFDINGNAMPCINPANCQPLQGSANSTQSVLIVPQPTCRGCEYLFNVFTTTEINGIKNLTLSVVDMRQNQGKGAIMQQNKVLQNPTTERLASIKNDKDPDDIFYWTISHDYGTNQFHVFKATTGGLVEEKSPAVGMVHDTPNKGEGYMKFLPLVNGKRQLAVIIPGPPNNYVEIFNFDEDTGDLTLDKTLDLGAAPPTAYGLEFSPDGEKMYVTFQGDNTTKSSLKQYDLTFDKDLIVSSAILVDESDTEKYGAVQLAPDGKIYMAIEGSDYLASISQPSRNSLVDIKYVHDGVNLGGAKSNLGLPNMVQNFSQEGSGAGFDVDGFCVGAPTTFTGGPLCDPLKGDFYLWDFGDGTTAATSNSTITHTYTKASPPGQPYLVTLTQTNQCNIPVKSPPKEVEIFDQPPPLALGDVTQCAGAPVVLDAGVDASVYEWRTKSGRLVGRSRTLTVTQDGDFILSIFSDPTKTCVSSDDVSVDFTPAPGVSLAALPPAICEGKSTVLTATRSGTVAIDSYNWSTGQNGTTLTSITVNQPGTYTVKVTDRNGCEASSSLLVGSLPSPVLDLAPEYFACFPDNQVAILDAKGQGALTYSWKPTGQTTQTITVGSVVNKSETYEVTAIDVNGCENTKKTEVIEQCEPRVFVPDAFTPQGDGQNETLKVFNAYTENYSLKIYNRWGEVIYATSSIKDEWDGTYKGIKVQPGVYPYVISYKAEYFPDRSPVIIRGSVMVIR